MTTIFHSFRQEPQTDRERYLEDELERLREEDINNWLWW